MKSFQTFRLIKMNSENVNSRVKNTEISKKIRLLGEKRDDICTICLEKVQDGSPRTKVILCGHKFHRRCLKPWAKICNSCPICRKSINKNESVRKFPYSSLEEDEELARRLSDDIPYRENIPWEEILTVHGIVHSMMTRFTDEEQYSNFCVTCGAFPCRCDNDIEN
jgi:hypothetical protein